MQVMKDFLQFIGTKNIFVQVIWNKDEPPADRFRTKENYFPAADIEKHLGWLKHCNAGGYDVYFTPAELSGERLEKINKDNKKYKGSRRDYQHFISNQHIYIDIDANGATEYAKLQKDIAAGKTLQPSCVVNTSPLKYHVYWKLNTPITDIETHKLYIKTLADKYNADPAAVDSVRLLRLPGFFHKTKNHFVKIISFTKNVYDLSQFIATEPSQTQSTASPSINENPANEQSREDFKTVCMLIMQGKSEPEIVSALQRNHASSKRGQHRQNDYFTRTIANATKKLQEENKLPNLTVKSKKLSISL